MFREALTAVRSGERARARDLLTRLLKMGQENADYWIWMSAVVETPKERLFCLKEALRVDPQNQVARRGLVIAGALPPQEGQVLRASDQKRGWQAALAQQERPARSIPPVYMLALMAVALLVVVGLVGYALFGEQLASRPKRRLVIVVPTQTGLAVTEPILTTTTTPRDLPSGSPTPLWALLEATYTPTPLYVNTPHMSSEAFGVGLRALQRGEWSNADSYFRQAATQVAISEPNAPDILFYLGENYRMQGNTEKALEIYNQVISLSPDFAPGYLGRGRLRLAQGSSAMVEAGAKDIQAAIEKDPNYGEAYLALAGLQIDSGQAQDAMNTLDQALTVLPDSPLVFLYRAQAFLELDDYQNALLNARRANALDVTLLLAYRVIGEALQAEGDLEGSIGPLATYVQFEQNDAQAWFSLADAYLFMGDSREALSALDRGLRLNNRRADAYLNRAEIYLEMGSHEKALEDFQSAAQIDPELFEAGLGIGKALMALGYPGDAWDRFERTRRLAKTELQKAELIFWRGQSLDALGSLEAAIRDYRALIDLPPDQVKEEWVRFAEERLRVLITQTPTLRPKTATLTPSPTFTRQPTRTATPTPRR